METFHEKTSIRDVEELDDLLSEPTEDVTRSLASLEGDVMILGVGGKMGPTWPAWRGGRPMPPAASAA